MRAAVKAFLEAAGLDLRDPNLRQTAERVTDAWSDEFLAGYGQTAAEALAARSLLLQIEWSVLSLPPPAKDRRRLRAGASAADLAAAFPDTYALTMGTIVPRRAAALAKLDVFRTTWRDEENASGSRWALGEEVAASFDA